MISGDFEAIVQVEYLTWPHEWSKAGIMARAALSEDSEHASVILSSENGVRLIARQIVGGYSINKEPGEGVVGSYPTTGWLKLARQDDLFAAWWKEDISDPWSAPVVIWADLPDNIYLGLATTSHSNGNPVEVIYRDFQISPLSEFPSLTFFGPFPGHEGGDGYMGIREVADNGDIRNQDNCYDSLNLETGNIVDYVASTLNVYDSGERGNFLNDDVFGVVTAYLLEGDVNDISIVVKGTIEIQSGGYYTFCVSSDDGFTLQFPGQDFTSLYGPGWSGIFPEIVPFENGNALRFWGTRGMNDTLGVINLPAGEHPFVLTYHEGLSGSGIEFSAAAGVKTLFDEDFELVGYQGGTVPVPGLIEYVNVAATDPFWYEPIESLQDAIDVLNGGSNFEGYYPSVNFCDPGYNAGPVDGGAFPGDEPFPNDGYYVNDDDFGVMVSGTLAIPEDGIYQIGFNSDDGSQLRILEDDGITPVSWNGIVPGSHSAAVIQDDWLKTDIQTGWSWTAGEVFLDYGHLYEFELYMFEHIGSADLELFGRGQGPNGWSNDWHLLTYGGVGYIVDIDGLQLTQPTPLVVQTVPNIQDFDSNLPGVVEGWEYYSYNKGRIEVVDGRLCLNYSMQNLTHSLNEAILHLNLSYQSNVILELDHWNTGEDNHSLPSYFIGHCNGDGIALSVDGTNWVKITDLTDSFFSGIFNLDSVIQDAMVVANSSDLSNVRIKFQQYDLFTDYSVGRKFDNIQIFTTGGIFGNQQVISTDADGAFSVYACDMDSDGDNDVLSVSTNDGKIAWYENIGGGTFGFQQVIDINQGGRVYACDLDSDGDNDVLCSTMSWYENLGGGTFGPQQIISTDSGGSLYACDLDGDGDNDILSSAIAWYENLGEGAFGAQQMIDTGSAISVYACDLDGDGDNDVLSAYIDDTIAWYENTGGGIFGPQLVISTLADYAQWVYACDLDGDGDNDVLSASGFDDKIAWYETLGGGTFGSQLVITTLAHYAVSV